MEARRRADPPERIEVELTLVGPDALHLVEVPDEAGSADRVERRRLLTTALVVGVVGLLVGIAIGRAGDPDRTAAGGDATVTTAPPRGGASDELGDVVPPVAAADLAVTTAQPGWHDDIVAVDRRLAAAGVELVALTLDGVMTMSVNSGARSTYTAATLGAGLGSPRSIFAGDDWVLVYNPQAHRADLLEQRLPARRIRFGANALVSHRPGVDGFDVVELEGTVGGSSTWAIREQPYDGSPARAVTQFDLPATSSVRGVDPAGGLIVSNATGGEYRVDALGVSRWLSSGLLLGLSESKLVVSECGATLDQCHIDVVDRGTGQRHTVPAAADAPAMPGSAMFEPAFGDTGSLLDNISPSGEYVAVASTPGSVPVSGLLSLSTGEFVALAQASDDSAIRWSRDGRLAFYEDQGRIMAYDTIDRTTITASPSDVYVLAFTTRAT